MRVLSRSLSIHIFFFNDTATTKIYTRSLHDALPISFVGALARKLGTTLACNEDAERLLSAGELVGVFPRSEEHTSELQSRQYLVCCLLLEKKYYEDDAGSVYHILKTERLCARRHKRC